MTSPEGEVEGRLSCGQDFNQQLFDLLTSVSGCTVQRGYVLDSLVARGYTLPEVHSQFRRQAAEVVGKVLDLVRTQLAIKDVLGLHLLDDGVVVVDGELLHQVHTTFINDVLDCDLTLVVLHKVVEGYRTFKADEGSRQVVQSGAKLNLVKAR